MDHKSPPDRLPSLLHNINWRTLVAGTAGGVMSTALFHPLELVKIRWQVYEAASLGQRLQTMQLAVKASKVAAAPHQSALAPTTAVAATTTTAPSYRPKYMSLAHTVSTVYRQENGVRGLYRGLLINTTASGAAWGAYFLIYNSLKSRHDEMNRARVGDNSSSSSRNKGSRNGQLPKLTLANYATDATIAGVCTIFVTNPLFLIKTRMCLQYSAAPAAASAASVVHYRSSWHALVTLLRTDGFFGLYKGIVPGLFGTLNGTIQMVTYDTMKSFWVRRLQRQQQHQSTSDPSLASLHTAHYTVFSSLSKILAVVCTYPFQVVRARLQDQHQSYTSFFDAVSRTYRHERLYGFYKGLLPCLMRVTPAAAVTFVVYENLLRLL